MKHVSEELLMASCSIAKKAGNLTLNYYQKNNLNVIQKTDQSPLTQADLVANHAIMSELSMISDIPIISEERQPLLELSNRKLECFWLVDPLDGTKEFIKGSDEFTVNIALIENERPVLGVVYAPALDKLYYGAENIGAFYQTANNSAKKLPFTESSNVRSALKVVISASHSDKNTVDFVKQLGIIFDMPITSIAAGSSLKICLLATGEADLYPRLGNTYGWDIAAGHAILRCAGGELYCLEKNNPMCYLSDALLNPYFIGVSATTMPFEKTIIKEQLLNLK